MKNAIIVCHDPFAMQSKINVIKDGRVCKSYNTKSTIRDLAESIVNIAEDEQVFTVKTSLEQSWKDELENSIKTFETYGKNKITVEDI